MNQLGLSSQSHVRTQRRARRNLAGGLAVLGAVLIAGCTSDGEPQSAASSTETTDGSAVTITINDPDAIGVLGDDLLSLAEGIQLASGTVKVDELSAAEAEQIDGAPGADSPDQLRFDVDGDRVEVPVQSVPEGMDWEPAPADTLLPELSNNAGDTLLGDGVTIANGPEGSPIGGLALRINSSDVTVTATRFERFAEMISVQPLTEAGISGVELAGNSFHDGGGISLTATAKDGSIGKLEGIVIDGNELLGPPEFGGEFPRSIHSAIGANGTLMTAPNTSGRSAEMNDITITDNVIRGFQGGLSIAALQSVSGNRGGSIDGMLIEGNTVEMPSGAGDPAVYLWGAVNLGGAISDVSVRNVRIIDNDVRSNGYAVLVAGVEHLLANTTTSTSVSVDAVEISGNRVAPVDDCSIGVLVMGAFTEMGGGPATDVQLTEIDVTGNEVENCETGVFATPVLNWGTAGVSTGNSIDALRIERNTILGATRSVVAAAGAVMGTSLDYDNAPDAGVADNKISGLSIIDANDGGAEVVVAGGIGWGAPGSVTRNSVTVDTLDVAGACSAEADVRIDTDASVTGNSISGATC